MCNSPTFDSVCVQRVANKTHALNSFASSVSVTNVCQFQVQVLHTNKDGWHKTCPVVLYVTDNGTIPRCMLANTCACAYAPCMHGSTCFCALRPVQGCSTFLAHRLC